MPAGIQKMKDFFAFKKGAPIYQMEFGFFTIQDWIDKGYIKNEQELHELCQFDTHGRYMIWELGWCEAGFNPLFEVKVLEDRGEYELEQDHAGRHVLYFKGRRNGFMPEYVDHPVKDMQTWKRDVEWRMDPNTPSRYVNLEKRMAEAQEAEKMGSCIVQNIIGGYMYLRSLMGPEGILYAVHDQPELVHACMETWFKLADTLCAKHQEYITFDDVFFGEDICYNMGPLISPAMIREFLFPYYQQLLTNIKRRQKDKTRKLHIELDSDGDIMPILDMYINEIGVDYADPFEVASGCDVVEVRKKYPNLLIRGGIDKRILVKGKDAIDREMERIIPFMRAQGGYIPTCDHGVPEEVSFENYMHYRKRALELGNG